jgi:hypothetical protein
MHMDAIEFEEPEYSACACCGRKITNLTRFVTRDENAYAVYYVQFTEGHEGRRAAVMVGLGDWDENALADEARVSFAFYIWPSEDSYQVSIIDPDDSPWTTDFLGRRLVRAEALEHPLLPEVFALSDHVVLCDEPLAAFLYPEGV